MEIPKYIKEILKRSEYNFSMIKNENYGVGYTIKVAKNTAYTHIHTFKKELERMVNWANKQTKNKCAYILYIPENTHYTEQFAIVTIFDPVMQKIEQYIKTAE